MSIKSNFEYKGTAYDEVIFKIVRVFGSKREGYNAVFAFTLPTDDFVEKNFKGLLPIGIEWVDANPYPALYKAMEDNIVQRGFTITPEVVELPPEVIPEVVELPPEVIPPVAIIEVADIDNGKVHTKPIKKAKKVKANV